MRQSYSPWAAVLGLMRSFGEMANACIRIGIAKDASTRMRLAYLGYHSLAKFNVTSYYKVSAISMAAGILASRKKSIRRGRQTKSPYQTTPMLITYYGFKVVRGALIIPTGNSHLEEMSLNRHTLEVLADPTLKVNSFTLTETSLSISYSRQVEEVKGLTCALGVDRNLRNLAVGDAVKDGGAIALEDIRDIRRLYQRRNWQGRSYRGMMNNWPFAEIGRQIEYKAAWAGIPVIHLTKGETRGTSSYCYRCGERLQGAARMDVQHDGQLWCPKCEMWFDRDPVAVMNISRKEWVRFAHSKGEAVEAMRGNQTTPAILRVDVSKGRDGR